MKKLSVCIPTYGPPRTLSRCIDSVREYTEYPDYELLIIDDGTNSKAVNRLIKKESDRCRILPENTGNANVRNKLIKMSRGHYIAQLDSDTVVSPGWATKLITALEGWGDKYGRVEIVAALLTCQMGYFLNRPDPMNEYELIQVATVGNACTMYRKELFVKIGLFDAELYNLWSDLDFCRRLGKRGDEFEPIPKVVIDPRTVAYHHGWTDQDGNMVEEYSENTRSLESLNTPEQKVRQLQAMKIIRDRWGITHDKLAILEEVFGDVRS